MMLAWIRRIVVSIGIGGASFGIMLGMMILSIVYDRELEPVITYAFDTGRKLIAILDGMVSGSHWGQVAVNHLRERVNMTHVVLSIPAIIIAAIVVGIPFNWLLGGTRSALQRIAIALVSVPATVVLAVALFTFNALVPDSYAALLRFADWQWSERGWRYHSRCAQVGQCRTARFLGTPLCNHGTLQRGGIFCRKRAVCLRYEVEFGRKLSPGGCNANVRGAERNV
jgi:hypothetical protein